MTLPLVYTEHARFRWDERKVQDENPPEFVDLEDIRDGENHAFDFEGKEVFYQFRGVREGDNFVVITVILKLKKSLWKQHNRPCESELIKDLF